AVAQPTTGTFTDLVRARELTGDTPSRHIPLQRHAPRNKRRAPSSFVWRARRAGTLVTARSGAPLSLEIGPNFPLGISSWQSPASRPRARSAGSCGQPSAGRTGRPHRGWTGEPRLRSEFPKFFF